MATFNILGISKYTIKSTLLICTQKYLDPTLLLKDMDLHLAAITPNWDKGDHYVSVHVWICAKVEKQ